MGVEPCRKKGNPIGTATKGRLSIVQNSRAGKEREVTEEVDDIGRPGPGNTCLAEGKRSREKLHR